MKRTFHFGSRPVTYSLEYSARKTLGIAVTPELDVIVRAPEGATKEKIDQKLRKRASWIIKQQDFFIAFLPKTQPKKFTSGETHLYLGKEYILKMFPERTTTVKVKGNRIHVFGPNKIKRERAFRRWYRERAFDVFAQYSSRWIRQFAKYNVTPASIKLRAMPKRWGSCSTKGEIILNPELIKAPKRCIEYVIVHELCHLVYRNHTRKFLNLQTSAMPHWQKWKDKLERLLA